MRNNIRAKNQSAMKNIFTFLAALSLLIAGPGHETDDSAY